ncbi:MAG: Rieske 2Fe-2S domain-containing protein [Caldilineaceae bacterium]|nr:Rieske 2Fe-2S domain-containing protein [Caldilineaceae bacterium]
MNVTLHAPLHETIPSIHKAARSAFQPQPTTSAGRYFRAMAEFVGFTEADAAAIKQSAPIIEQHMSEIVGSFYTHLLRYPPTRKFFLKPDGSIDQEYLELRMRHLTNFWLRTATGVYDDEYAQYLEYVGRAHTARGANPGIYIAARYVIGQVGFMQHAISTLLMRELRETDPARMESTVEAWDKLLMVLLEMLTSAYTTEQETVSFNVLPTVDKGAVNRLAMTATAREQNGHTIHNGKQIHVAHVDEIPDGCRKIVEVEGLSIGVFHHNGAWYALRNYCLHRGGPVATGALEGDTLVCPWHQFRYNVTDGRLLVDPNVKLDTYPVTVANGEVYITVPAQPVEAAPARPVAANELALSDLKPGQMGRVQVDGRAVAVYNVDGRFYATQDQCTHMGGPLSEGELEQDAVTCPWHGACFNVRNGHVNTGPATEPLTTYQVTVMDDRIRVTG